MIMDIDGLKAINDVLGSDKGTELIKNVSKVITDVTGMSDDVFRIGGDEFAVILCEMDDKDADVLRTQIQRGIKTLSQQETELSLSIGVSTKVSDSESCSDLAKRAEEDMYRKKVIVEYSIRNRAIMGILSILTDKYNEEGVHSKRVSDLCQMVGMSMGMSKEDLGELKMAAMLHDIGKIAIPDRILDKPGALNDEEWHIMKQHTSYGYNILKAADEYSNLALYALTHHERYDGSGYPGGMKGEEIPLFSRIIAVGDAYEAMTSDRVYRNKRSSAEAIKELRRCSGTQFDPDIVGIFIDVINEVEAENIIHE